MSAVVSIEDYHQAASGAVAAVAEIPDASLVDPTVKERISQLIEKSVARVAEGNAAADHLSATLLARMLVDAGGPRRPGHPVFQAFGRLEELRTAIALASPADSNLLPRTSLADLSTASSAVLAGWWRAFRVAGVQVPVIADPERNTVGPPSLRTVDGAALIPVFTDPDLAAAWASAATDPSRLSFRVMRLSDLAAAAVAGGSGIALNPLDENVGLRVDFLATHVSPTAIPPGEQVNLGRPAEVPPGLASAIHDWAARESTVSRVVLAQAATADGRNSLLLTIVTARPETSDRLGSAWHEVLPSGVRVDLVPAETDLGRAVAELGTTLYSQV